MIAKAYEQFGSDLSTAVQSMYQDHKVVQTTNQFTETSFTHDQPKVVKSETQKFSSITHVLLIKDENIAT